MKSFKVMFDSFIINFTDRYLLIPSKKSQIYEIISSLGKFERIISRA